MKLRTITDYLESHAPLHYQESYDNSGLICGNLDMDVTGIVVSLDATEAVIDEAISLGANVVISHHPIVFSGLKRFNGSDYIQRSVIKAIKNDIALYAIHTNLDNVLIDGVNTKIADKLGLTDLTPLQPFPGGLEMPIPRGTGVLGKLSAPMKVDDFLQHVKTQMYAGAIRYTRPTSDYILKVAVCGGSGSFLLPFAIAGGADVFITADFKYHQFFDANDEIMIADIGHYESEQFTIDLIKELISKKFSNFALYSTKINTNPIKYF